VTIPLLTTKFYIPTLCPNLVPRLPLVERLDQGLQHGHRLALISAPAGFGKTTLVTEWLYSKAPNISSRSIAWLALDEGDNDPARFFTYLIAALQQIDEHIGLAAQSLLGAPQLPSFEALTTLIINDIEATSPFVLVLDDYHLIHTALIHEVLAFLVEHQPPQMHLCLVTREDPPFALPRLRVRGQITEIRAHDLRFTVQEAATFLNQVLNLVLDADSVAALETRTEGWVAGLQMAALSMQSRDDPAGFIAAFSGSNRHIIDYLADEVLNQQPSEIRDFFRQTSILERLNAPLCDALTERENSDKVLKQLEQANLFIVPLDDQRKWYRYHQLFADFLRTELVPEQAARLHLRAARWFETQDLLPEAVNHILAYAAATGDTLEAVQMITQAGNRALSDGAVITLLSWLDALPDEIVRASSWLAAYKAWCLLMTGQPDLVSRRAGALPRHAALRQNRRGDRRAFIPHD
jgi:LuxR family maltose regulon positive regulatory protein